MNPQLLLSKSPNHRVRYFILTFLFSAFVVCCLLVAFGFGPDNLHLSDHPVILFFICSLSLMSAIVCANMFSMNSGNKTLQQQAPFEMESHIKSLHQYGNEMVSIDPSEIFWTKNSEDNDSLSLQAKKEGRSAAGRSRIGNNESFTSKTRVFSEFQCLFSKN